MALTFTDAHFEEEVINSDLPVLVDFWAQWCGPCISMGPVIEALAKENEGKMKIGKLDVDANPKTAQQFGIMSIPSLKIFKNGEVVDEMVGAMSKEALQEKIDAHL